MKKVSVLFLLIVFSCGCTTAYKFQTGKPPFDQGYVVARRGYVIPEYTVGADKSVPKDMSVAEKRFKRRKDRVEDSYKRMGYIQNGFMGSAVDSVFMIGELIVGIFKWPFTAVSEYKYNHNALYRQKMDKLDEEKEAKELERVGKLKAALDDYIQKDLSKEGLTVKPTVLAKEKAASKPEAVISQPQEPIQEAPAVKEAAVTKETEEKAVKPAAGAPQAASIKELEHEMIQEKVVSSPVKSIIVAKPLKGFSPLTVRFYGNRSHSTAGRIISYSWEFGDGDMSTKENAINTYYSGSVEPKQFTATLTVRDNKGNSAASAVTIEVLNK
ncbi:MAG: PKD domain-containing protein [Candidatus Omnitrophota bacterium]